MANTENANVNWKICATTNNKKTKRAYNGGSPHTHTQPPKHIYTYTLTSMCRALKRFDLCAKNYASTATGTSSMRGGGRVAGELNKDVEELGEGGADG